MIRITPENAAAIQAILKQANGNAAEHAFTTFAEINAIARRAESQLEDFGLPLRNRIGAQWIETSGGAVGRRYRYARRATKVHLLRRPTGWYLVEVMQAKIYESPGKTEKIKVTRAQEAEIVKRVRAQFEVLKDEK